MKARKSLALVLVLSLLLSLVPTMGVFAYDESFTNAKFDFGTADSAVADGYTKVTPQTVYNEGTGYGWLNDERIIVTAGDSGNADALKSDWVTGNTVQDGADITKPENDAEGNYIHFTYPTFVVDVPNGIYTVKTIQGDYNEKTVTGAIVEDMRSFAPYYKSLPNESSIPTSVNTTNAGSFKETTKQVAVYDGQLTIELTGTNSRLNAVEISKVSFASEAVPGDKPTVYICSDSTAYGSATNKRETGWGNHLADYMTDDVIVKNTAMGGRSARDYLADGLLNDSVLKNIKPGDYVLIQFGHNDCTPIRPNRYSNPAEFKEWLAKYVEAARAFGATPILVTPPNRGYTENGNKVPGETFLNSFQAWTDAQRELAAEMDVDLIEFNYYTIAYYNYIGWDRFVTEISTDCTHFANGEAASMAANQVSYLLSRSDTGLAPYATGAMTEGVADKYDFGAGAAATGYTPIGTDAYDAVKGYGWTTTGIKAVAGSGDDPLKSNYVQTTAKNQTFVIDVPNREYEVRILSGDSESATKVQYSIENVPRQVRRGWQNEGNTVVDISAGDYYDETIGVSVYDGQMTITFVNSGAKINGIEITLKPERNEGDIPTVYVIGDSVSDSYAQFNDPQRGWGQMLANYFDLDKINVENWGIGARTADRNIKEGRLEMVLEQIQPGDYMVFNFGFNEKTTGSTESWKALVEQYVDGAIQRGATPILVSSTASIRNGVGTSSQDYKALDNMRNACKEVAEEKGVAFIDNFQYTSDLTAEMGALRSQAMYLYVQPGIYTDSTYANGASDAVHLQTYGASVVASYIASEMAKLNSELYAAYTPKAVAAQAPAQPTGLYAKETTGTSATITWDEQVDADYYVVRYKESASSNWSEVAAVVYPQATVSGLKAGTSYDFAVYAYNDAGESAGSNTLTLPKASSSSEYNKLLNLVTSSKESFEAWRGMYVYTFGETDVNKIESAQKAATAVLADPNATADDYNNAYDALYKAGNDARSLIDGEYRFDFGSGAVADGYTGVTADTLYTSERGYGWSESVPVTDVDRNTGDALYGDFAQSAYQVTTDGSIYPEFKVDLPNGKYLVHTIQGDATDGSSGGVYAEGINLNTSFNCVAGSYSENYFLVEVTDGQLNLEFPGFLMKLNGVEIYSLNRELPQTTASADKDQYEPDETITVTINTPDTVEKAYLVGESGNGLATTREVVDNGDGTKTWTLTFSLATKGNRTLKVYADGEDTGVSISFKIDNAATGKAKLYSVSVPETATVNEPFTVTFETNQYTEYVRLFNESGAGMAPTSCSYVDEGDVRVWTYTISVGSAGMREFQAGVASADRVFTKSAQTVSIQVRR